MENQFYRCSLILILLTLCTCCNHHGFQTTTGSKHFKTEIPFRLDRNGIIIDTYWGQNQSKHSLIFDNHSPTWMNNTIVNNSTSTSIAKNYRYKTSTADNTKIAGKVYQSDSVTIGSVVFKKVLCYSISNKSNTKVDGVFGENMITQGIWKIDFKNSILTFASDLDSIKGFTESQKLPVTFKNNNIELKVTFLNGISKTLEVDLGFNWGILLPISDFREVTKDLQFYQDSLAFSTPASNEHVLSSEAITTIKVQNDSFITQVSSNSKVVEYLLGLLFFRQFEYIILDYLNKSVYVSIKKSWNSER